MQGIRSATRSWPWSSTSCNTSGRAQSYDARQEAESRLFHGGMALIFFLPLMLVVALAVFATITGRFIFVQRSIRRGGPHFRCLRFRMMAVDAEQRLALLLATDPQARIELARDHKLRNDPRITTIGHFLLKSSLDELPQLISVLLGKMSLVGPRTIVDAEAKRYGHYFAVYCRVRPGITGLWQISGRNGVLYRRRVAFEVAYSRSRSIIFATRILFAAILSVLKARGSYWRHVSIGQLYPVPRPIAVIACYFGTSYALSAILVL